MRKVFLSILLLTSLFIKAQQAPPGFVPNYANTAFRALSGYGLFGMPQDTFAIPTADRMLRWSAYHGDTTYIWSVLQQKWIISSGGTPTLSALTIASPLTGGSYNGLAPISIGVDTNIIHTSAYNDGRYSTGIGTTIYTGDGSLPTNRTIDLNGHNLEFQQSGVDWFSMIPGNFTTQIRATDGTGTTYLVLNADVSDPTVKFELYSDNGTNEVSILGNATTDNIIYTADTHTFNGGVGVGITPSVGDLFRIESGGKQYIYLYPPDETLVLSSGGGNRILMDDVANSIAYTADTHTFNFGTSILILHGPDEALEFSTVSGKVFTIGDDFVGYQINAGSGGSATYTADTHTFNGEIISNSLKSGSSAPTTNGITKVVVSDADGRLSFKDSAAIGVTSVARTNGFGISASVADPTTTPNITIGIDSASSALKSYIAQNAITSFTETAEEFTGSTSSSVTVAHTPLTSKARVVYFNGVLMNAANVAIVGTGFTISGITRATSDVITVKYSY